MKAIIMNKTLNDSVTHISSIFTIAVTVFTFYILVSLRAW